MGKRLLASGNEAIALAAMDCGVSLGVGYPGTPSSEILENLSDFGGKAEWAPNEKCALEVAIGAAFCKGRALCTMKHVGVNVAADPLFTIAYAGTPGGLVLVSADDPGMASSQNEQDNRRYAIAAGVPMFEPSDSQECYDFLIRAFELSEQFRRPVLFRVTTRVCHSKCILERREPVKAPEIGYEKDSRSNVMIPAYAKIAHRKLRAALHEMEALNEKGEFTREIRNSAELGIITSGISFQHVRDAAPEASVLKLGFTYPLPMETIKRFVNSVKRCLVVEEGDPVLEDAIRAAGCCQVEGKAEMFRFGELDVQRVRRLIANDTTPETPPPPGKPPQLCVGCPHRRAYEVLRDMNCIVSGDIGCYTLGVLPPFDAVDTCVCMGASVTVGLGMRQVLPEAEARRVVSVIGDSTFLHTGINGIVEMVYNRPKTGHVVIILDNSTTAMTGLQENPATGRLLNHTPSSRQVSLENVVKGIGVDNVDICDPTLDKAAFEELLKKRLASNDTTVIICRRPCILAAVKIKSYSQEG